MEDIHDHPVLIFAFQSRLAVNFILGKPDKQGRAFAGANHGGSDMEMPVLFAQHPCGLQQLLYELQLGLVLLMIGDQFFKVVLASLN